MKTYKFILLLILFVSCKNPKDQFLDDFGLFINDTEANYDQYTDTEFKILEINFKSNLMYNKKNINYNYLK